MRTAQVIGNFSRHPTVVTKIEQMLSGTGIQLLNAMTHHEYSLSSSAEHHYKTEVHLFNEIVSATFLVLHCGDTIDSSASNKILYAMFKRRPIIIIGKPTFEKSIGYYTKTIIKSRLKQFYTINLPELEEDELRYLLKNLPLSVDYALTHTQQVLVRSHVKAYLHELFIHTKK